MLERDVDLTILVELTELVIVLVMFFTVDDVTVAVNMVAEAFEVVAGAEVGASGPRLAHAVNWSPPSWDGTPKPSR